jgi:hypothetical protein
MVKDFLHEKGNLFTILPEHGTTMLSLATAVKILT